MQTGYRIERHSPESFHRRAVPWLLRREAEHNLLLGIAAELVAGNNRYGEPIYLATVEHDGEVVGCAFRTPPYKAGLTCMPLDAVPALAADLREMFGTLPAIMGPAVEANAFADAWLPGRGYSEPDLQMRIFALRQVTPPPQPAPGSMRLASAADLELTASWAEAFARDAHVPIGGNSEDVARHFINERELYLWVDRDPVSMAVATGPTPGGIRIGFVYTPRERRGHGYASVLVGALSQAMLEGGRDFCFLYTDAANPTSNAIYQRLGYRHVCDVVDVALDESG